MTNLEKAAAIAGIVSVVAVAIFFTANMQNEMTNLRQDITRLQASSTEVQVDSALRTIDSAKDRAIERIDKISQDLDAQLGEILSRTFAEGSYIFQEYEYTGRDGDYPAGHVLTMIPASSGFCYATGHNGSFSWGSFRIVQHEGFWKVHHFKHPGKNTGGYAFYATCVKFEK